MLTIFSIYATRWKLTHIITNIVNKNICIRTLDERCVTLNVIDICFHIQKLTFFLSVLVIYYLMHIYYALSFCQKIVITSSFFNNACRCKHILIIIFDINMYTIYNNWQKVCCIECSTQVTFCVYIIIYLYNSYIPCSSITFIVHFLNLGKHDIAFHNKVYWFIPCNEVHGGGCWYRLWNFDFIVI